MKRPRKSKELIPLVLVLAIVAGWVWVIYMILSGGFAPS